MRLSLVLVACFVHCGFSAVIDAASSRTRFACRRAEGGPDQEKADAVKQVFLHAWNGYYEYAFPNDELKPADNTFGNSRNGWGASAVDALSTALIMELPEVVDQILEHIATIDFSHDKTDKVTSVFETTIRYLAGMLSGYDLLKGPLAHLAANPSNVDVLLTQSVNLANILSHAFSTPSGIPNNGFFVNNLTQTDANTTGLAVAGTLILEWTHLADLTGNTTYHDLVSKAESYLLNPTPAPPFPGLLGSDIALSNGSFTNAQGGWSGGTDSYYEYLLKMYIYSPTRFAAYRTAWEQAADSSIRHLASHPSSRPSLTFLAEFNGTTPVLNSEHLTCFDGGNFILAGLVLANDTYTSFGLDLVDACHATYTATATGIGPESFGWAVDANATGVPVNQTDFYNEHGFFVKNDDYILRPEVLESIYYAYRATRDGGYQAWVWDAFVAINGTTRVGSGFSGIEDVRVEGGGGFTNMQESFWFAEVLKYVYLTFAGEAEWQVGGGGGPEGQRWVFNTEAHPFRVGGGSRWVAESVVHKATGGKVRAGLSIVVE